MSPAICATPNQECTHNVATHVTLPEIYEDMLKVRANVPTFLGAAK